MLTFHNCEYSLPGLEFKVEIKPRKIAVHFTFLGSPLNLTPNPDLNLILLQRAD
jgi:hypothetical protein